jgi:hypothetical protein
LGGERKIRIERKRKDGMTKEYMWMKEKEDSRKEAKGGRGKTE